MTNLMPRRGSDSLEKRLLLLPGSRRSEIRRMLPVMRDAYALLAADSHVAATLVTVSHLVDDVAAILGSDSRIKIISGNDALHQQLHQADAMMAASGTVTLQTALAGVPGVACYRTSLLSALIGRRLVRMDRVILPNTLLQREVYPFFFSRRQRQRHWQRISKIFFQVPAICRRNQTRMRLPDATPANCGRCCGVAKMTLKRLWQRRWYPISSYAAEPGFGGLTVIRSQSCQNHSPAKWQMGRLDVSDCRWLCSRAVLVRCRAGAGGQCAAPGP